MFIIFQAQATFIAKKNCLNHTHTFEPLTEANLWIIRQAQRQAQRQTDRQTDKNTQYK